MKATVGVDFGTESARAVLVDVDNGRELASAVVPFASGVIDERLPGSTTPLGGGLGTSGSRRLPGVTGRLGARRPLPIGN